MAAKAGIALETYKKYEADRVTPGGDALGGLGILGIDLTWLLTGRGSDQLALMRPYSVNLTRQVQEGYETSEAFALVPLYDVRAAAGHGALAEDRPAAEHRAFSRVWLSREVGVPPSRLRIITVAGDSMVPELFDGDEVMIDTGDIETLREGIYVFFLDGHIYVKRLALEATTLVIRSSNPAAGSPQPLDLLRAADSFRLIARLVGQPLFKRL